MSVPAVFKTSLLTSPTFLAYILTIEVVPSTNPLLDSKISSDSPSVPVIVIKNYPTAPDPFILGVITYTLYGIFTEPSPPASGNSQYAQLVPPFSGKTVKSALAGLVQHQGGIGFASS